MHEKTLRPRTVTLSDHWACLFSVGADVRSTRSLPGLKRPHSLLQGKKFWSRRIRTVVLCVPNFAIAPASTLLEILELGGLPK